MNSPSLDQRYWGSVLGLAVGDALGVPVESQKPGTFEPVTDMRGYGAHSVQAGAWSDDTSNFLCLSESFLEQRCFDPADQKRRYCRWLYEGHLSSIGRSFGSGSGTRNALRDFTETGQTYLPMTDAGSAGNGSLMRTGAVALAYRKIPEAALVYADLASRTTHPNVRAVDACRFFVGVMVGALQGRSKEEILSPRFSPVGGYYEALPLCPEIDAIAQGSYRSKMPPDLRATGYVVHTLEAALWCFYHAASFEQGVLMAVNLGDDTDTTAAVYGQLAGAFYGLEAIPPRWSYCVMHRTRLGQFAHALLGFSERAPAYVRAELAASPLCT